MSLISGNESKIFAKGVIGNVRKAQEDCHGYKMGTPNGNLFVVCDGMGGHVGGAMASKIAVDSILSYIDQEKYANPVDALNGALQFANMQILGYAESHPEFKGMGTTACVVLVRGFDVWIAHVGDSRIYLYLGKEEQLHRITKDHSFVQTLVDAGQITDEQAEHHPNKNRIMKALGIKPELQPTINDRPIFPKKGDIFLICSDGLSGMIPDRTIERVLGEKQTLYEKGDRLIELAMEGETVNPGGQDNCTVELVEIDGGSYKTSVFKSYNPKDTTIVANNYDNRKKKFIMWIIVAVAALLIIMGVSIWTMNPARFDNAIKKQGDVVEKISKQFDEKNAELLELEKFVSQPIVILSDTSVDPELANKKYEAQKRQQEKSEKKVNELKKDVERIKGQLTDAQDKQKKLKERQEKLTERWGKLFPSKKNSEN